jgi:small subunit ribosomal protein S10
MKFLNQQKSTSNVQIKLKSVYKESLMLYAQFLNFFLKKLFFNVSIFTLPKTRKRVTLLKSPHVNKTAKEQFEIFYYQILITIKEPVDLKKIKFLFLNKPKSIQLKIKL